MTEHINQPQLSADKPVLTPDQDRLGYKEFARALATSITYMAPQEGLVMAIYGPWGSGKTTVLNFITHFINEMPESERAVVIQFNPWWFSGHEDLVRIFFGQLLSVLG